MTFTASQLGISQPPVPTLPQSKEVVTASARYSLPSEDTSPAL